RQVGQRGCNPPLANGTIGQQGSKLPLATDSNGPIALPRASGDEPMQQTSWGILVLMLNLTLAADGNGQEKPATPAEKYKGLRKEAERAGSSGVSMTDAERLKFVGQAYKRRFTIAQKFLELAEKYPNDPIALDSLMQAVWQVNGTPWPLELVGEDIARPKAF